MYASSHLLPETLTSRLLAKKWRTALRSRCGSLNPAENTCGTPRLARGESLVRVLRAGICNTDIEITKGYMGFHGVLGHEFVGIVESGELKGERVVGEINAYCGECATCRRGDETHCPNRTTLGIAGREGALAEYLRDGRPKLAGEQRSA